MYVGRSYLRCKRFYEQMNSIPHVRDYIVLEMM